MNNEKLMSKIRTVSRISVVGAVIYIAVSALRFVPDAVKGFKDGWNSVDADTGAQEEVMSWVQLMVVPFAIAFAAVSLIIIVSGLQVLFGMSRNVSPFNDKVSKAVKKLGISFIVFDVVKTVLYLFMYGTLGIGMVWLAGLILCAFALVFRYGTILQQESDELL
ncbi:hypothetical protein [Ruminococcus flavefaciens]|nr:hypothetical protein [Ruminococcus flavefaciens]